MRRLQEGAGAGASQVPLGDGDQHRSEASAQLVFCRLGQRPRPGLPFLHVPASLDEAWQTVIQPVFFPFNF